MKCLECDKYTVVMWHWIDCGSLYRSVCSYFAGMWHYCTSHYILTAFLLFMFHQMCGAKGECGAQCAHTVCIVLISTYHLLPLIFFQDSINHCC